MMNTAAAYNNALFAADTLNGIADSLIALHTLQTKLAMAQDAADKDRAKRHINQKREDLRSALVLVSREVEDLYNALKN